jgi:serine/threonine protein kinase
MGPDRWREIEQLYHAALDMQAGERASFLDHACATDVDLRKEVESLLAFAQDDGSRTQLTPKKLGRYQILEQLGQGGMGIVFRAVDPTINRTVAIKTILAGQDGSGEESRELRDRLLRESQAGGRLSQAHSVRGFISTAARKHGVKIESSKNDAGERTYRNGK